METSPGLQPAQTIPPKLIRSGAPQFNWPPGSERDALVMVRMDINEIGRVTDVQLAEGGFHDYRFVKESMKYVRAMRFSPATANGVPVPIQGLLFPLRFRWAAPGGQNPAYQKELLEVVRLMQARDFAGAHVHAQWMLSEKVRRLYEFAGLKAILAQTHASIGNPHRALAASREATAQTSMSFDDYVPGGALPVVSQNDFMLPANLCESILRLRFGLAANNGFYLDALKAHAALQGLVAIPADDPTMMDFRKILAHFETAPSLTATIRIDEDKVWYHELALRSFQVSDLTGTLSSIVVNCAGNSRKLVFSPGVNWTLPEGWSSCRLQFHGDAGTEFRLTEFRDTAPAAPAV